jgi:GNAT superfamily N-acetyltransferase
MHKPDGLVVEAFRGDFEELERMAHISWREEYGDESFPNFYRPAFLRFLYERIDDKRLFLAVYKGDEIVAFLANLPQRFLFKDRERSAVYSCLMVTRREYLRQGVASLLVGEALKLNQDLRCDFALFALEKGHGSTGFIKKLESAGHSVHWIRKFYLAARVNDLEKAAYSERLKGWEKAAVRLLGGHKLPRNKGLALRSYNKADLDDCHALLDDYRGRVTLCLLWTREELSRELNCPGVSHTLVFEKDGRVEAFINFIIHEHLGRTKERWAWINHVALHRLNKKDQRAFIRGFLHGVHEMGCIGVVEWIRGYYSLKPFFQTHFFPYFRYVNLVSWTFDPSLDLSGIKGVYEVQI